MRVLHMMGGGDVGGAKTHIMTLIQQLSRRNEVCLVSFRDGDFPREVEALGIPVHIFESYNLLSCRNSVLKLIRRFRPEIIHTHGSKANIVGVMVRQRCRIPLMTTVHSDYKLDYLGSPLKQYTIGTTNAVALRFIDFYQPVADNMAQKLIARGFDPERIRVICNGMDFSCPQPPFDRAAYIREQWGVEIAPDDILCGVAARLTAVKDIFTCIRGFAAAVKEEPRLRLLLAGDGEDEPRLRRLAKELGVEERVTFCGWVSPTNRFFAALDINMLTSVSEGFPYSILEGVREHCATICSDVGGLRDLIIPGENGFLFQPGDSAELAKYLVFFARNGDKRREFAQRLYEKATKEFSLESMCRLQEENYRLAIRRFGESGHSRDTVVICGAYGKGNAGDDAILEAIIQELREVDKGLHLTIVTQNTREARLRFRVSAIYKLDFLHMLRCFRQTKLFISGGGSLIQNVTSARSLQYYLITMALARRYGCRVMMYGCGIGPLNGERTRGSTGKKLNNYVDAITVRDSISLAELSRLGIRRPETRLTADPAFQLRPASETQVSRGMEALGIPPGGRYIGFCLRRWHGLSGALDAIAQAAQHAWDEWGLTPVFVPIEFPNDLEPARQAAKRLTCPYHLVETPLSVEMTIGVLGRMRTVVGMRLHSLIFSVGQSVPVVGISYDIKIDGFLRFIDSSMCVPLGEATAEKLCARIDRCVRGEMDGETAEIARRLRRQEQLNLEFLRKLLGAEAQNEGEA